MDDWWYCIFILNFLKSSGLRLTTLYLLLTENYCTMGLPSRFLALRTDRAGCPVKVTQTFWILCFSFLKDRELQILSALRVKGTSGNRVKLPPIEPPLHLPITRNQREYRKWESINIPSMVLLQGTVALMLTSGCCIQFPIPVGRCQSHSSCGKVNYKVLYSVDMKSSVTFRPQDCTGHRNILVNTQNEAVKGILDYRDIFRHMWKCYL
jgi:hypothetical protein